MRGLLSTAGAARTFVNGGNATITLHSLKTDKHLTYRIKRAKSSKALYVTLLNGPNNEADYIYLGVLRDNRLHLTHKSRAGADAPSVRAFNYFAQALDHDQIAPDLQVFHEGRCCRCARKLTVPSSIENGIGPECATKM